MRHLLDERRPWTDLKQPYSAARPGGAWVAPVAAIVSGLSPLSGRVSRHLAVLARTADAVSRPMRHGASGERWRMVWSAP
jgi:hypothetical protein